MQKTLEQKNVIASFSKLKLECEDTLAQLATEISKTNDKSSIEKLNGIHKRVAERLTRVNQALYWYELGDTDRAGKMAEIVYACRKASDALFEEGRKLDKKASPRSGVAIANPYTGKIGKMADIDELSARGLMQERPCKGWTGASAPIVETLLKVIGPEREFCYLFIYAESFGRKALESIVLAPEDIRNMREAYKAWDEAKITPHGTPFKRSYDTTPDKTPAVAGEEVATEFDA